MIYCYDIMWTKIDYFFEKNKGFYLFLLLLLPVSQYGRTNKLEKDIMKTISFNKVWLTGNEKNYITQALSEGKTCGNGNFTHKCQSFFEEKLGSCKCLLTTSCTDALEMCAMLAGIQPGDEVIVPSYTFVSTALAFVRQGARIVFADSRMDNPCIDEQKLEALVTPRTRAIVPVHYAGIACDMDVILAVAERHNLLVIEDAAQAIDSFYKGRPLGSIGHLKLHFMCCSFSQEREKAFSLFISL
jgi:dTDP-4-amino-4,6-dideoxygalactose transaminase